MQSIKELQKEVSDFINRPRKRLALVEDTAFWNMLWSCLDTLDDTELAIDAYEQSNTAPTAGDTYLLVYGLLQALVIQQDAVENLCQALVIEYTPDKLLREIKEIRNNSIGHPTRRGGGKGQAYNFIGRSSLRKEGFDLMTTYPDDRQPLVRHISVTELVKDQRELVRTALTKVLRTLKEDEADHRAKYRERRLEVVFPPTLGYYFQKIGGAIDGREPAFGPMHIQLVARVIGAFKERMKERGTLQAYPPLVNLIEVTEYPIHELAAYFSGTSTLNAKGAHIFAFFIDRHIEELKGMAKEIDEDYQSEP